VSVRVVAMDDDDDDDDDDRSGRSLHSMSCVVWSLVSIVTVDRNVSRAVSHTSPDIESASSSSI